MWIKSGLFASECQNGKSSDLWEVIFTNDDPGATVKMVTLSGFFDSDWCRVSAILKDSFNNKKKHCDHFETTLFIANFSILTQYNEVDVHTNNPDILAYMLFKLHDIQKDLIYPLIEICPAVGVKFEHTQGALPKWFKEGYDYVSTKPDPVIKKIYYEISKNGTAEVRFDFSTQAAEEKAFLAIMSNPELNSLEKKSIFNITVTLKNKEQLPLFEKLIKQLETFEPHLTFFHDHLMALLDVPWPVEQPQSVSLAASVLSMLRLESSPPTMDITDSSLAVKNDSSASLTGGF